MAGQEAIPVMMPAVLIAHEAFDRQRIPIVAPVVLRAPRTILADQAYWATQRPIMVLTPWAILTLHLVWSATVGEGSRHVNFEFLACHCR